MLPERSPISAQDVLTVKAIILPELREAIRDELAPIVADVAVLKNKRWRLAAVWTGISAALTFVGLELKNK